MRVISAWAIYANGEPWDLLNGGAIAYHAARIFQTNRAFMSEDGPIAARTLGLVIGRHIDGGLHEDIEIANNSRNPVRFNLEIAIRADFADIFAVKDYDFALGDPLRAKPLPALRPIAYDNESNQFLISDNGDLPLKKGRLVGCSAYEETQNENPYQVKYPQAPFIKDMPLLKISQYKTDIQDFYNHGFAIFDVAPDKITASYYEYPSWGQSKAPASDPPIDKFIYQETLLPMR